MLFGEILSINTCMGNNNNIHKFQGMEAGFDKNNQFQHVIKIQVISSPNRNNQEYSTLPEVVQSNCRNSTRNETPKTQRHLLD
jgi:hypothetical protein